MASLRCKPLCKAALPYPNKSAAKEPPRSPVSQTGGARTAYGKSDENGEGAEPALDGSKAAKLDASGVKLIPGERRKLELERLARGNGAEAILSAVTSKYSLESELLEAGNGVVLREAYLNLHPLSAEKWDKAAGLEGDARAKAIQGVFKGARKGDFAQELAYLIEGIGQNGHTFAVPKYIEDTIHEVVA